MQGKTVVITGATSGIGRAAALQLGRLGTRMILLGRNESAGAKVVRQLRRAGGYAEFFRADLSSLQEVRAVAGCIRQRHPTIDVLVNNAGARFDSYYQSADGYELTFATNHLGHFLLTCLLSDALLATSARVITVSSCAHALSVTEGGWQLSPASYSRHRAYAKSKLANLLFAYELAGRLAGTSVTSNAVDPGIVATRFGRNNGLLPWIKHWLYHGLRGELISARRAAETIVFLAASAASTNGKYFCRRREIPSSPASRDSALARSLWQLSLEWSGLSTDEVPAWARLESGFARA